MEEKILKAVSKARDFLEIEDFPGNFFCLTLEKKFDNNKIIVFKENIGKLSGFIGYGVNDYTVICVNYIRPIGHQNFTFAHELGHWFLHYGQNISDENVGLGLNTTDIIEKEANEFASELLYPERFFINDYAEANEKYLFLKKNRKKLAIYIDFLCHKYCMSFEAILRRLLYQKGLAKNYKKIRAEIDEGLGCKISEFFNKDFYVVNFNIGDYKQLREPYDKLKDKIDFLVEKKKLGIATSEAIKLRCGIEDIN